MMQIPSRQFAMYTTMSLAGRRGGFGTFRAAHRAAPSTRGRAGPAPYRGFSHSVYRLAVRWIGGAISDSLNSTASNSSFGWHSSKSARTKATALKAESWPAASSRLPPRWRYSMRVRVAADVARTTEPALRQSLPAGPGPARQSLSFQRVVALRSTTAHPDPLEDQIELLLGGDHRRVVG